MRWLLVLALLLFAVPAMAQDGPVVSVEIEGGDTIVGQPIVLRVKVLVPTWMPHPPDIPSPEVPGLVVRLPERASGPISESVAGDTWSGVQRAYRLYPLQPGTFTLPSVPVRVHYAEPGGIDPLVADVRTEEVRFVARVPRAAASLSPLIIAEGFELEQEMEPTESLAVGDAIERTLTARIEGTTPILIPSLIPEAADPTLRAYPKEPRVSEAENRGVLSGERQETMAYVAVSPGSATLPDISIDWFNLQTGKVETATVSGLSFTVTGDASATGGREIDWQSLIRVGLAALVAFALLRAALPHLRRWANDLHARWISSEPHAHRQVLSALRRRNLNDTYETLQAWAAFFPGADPAAIYTALAEIGKSRHGGHADTRNKARAWTRLTSAYRKLRHRCRAAAAKSRHDAPLPSLNPWPDPGQR